MREPLFILGTGRCGSTVVHRILSRHPDLSWLSQFCNTLPGRPEVNAAIMRALDVPFLRRIARRFSYPSEAYAFWDRYAVGFSRVTQDLSREDVIPPVRAAVREALGRATGGNRDRLLVKITGWPRAGFLREIFPDAKFVAVSRDGRAVAASGFLTPWFNGWSGPQNWGWGELTAEQRERWERHDRSFLALAALAWEILMDAQLEASRRVPDEDFLEIRYEDLCADPLGTFRRVTDFASLRWTTEFEERIASFTFRNGNGKWRRLLSERQRSILESCLSSALARHGYDGGWNRPSEP